MLLLWNCTILQKFHFFMESNNKICYNKSIKVQNIVFTASCGRTAPGGKIFISVAFAARVLQSFCYNENSLFEPDG